MTYRVVQWGSGWVGRQAIATIVQHPDLELVGVYAASAEKHGKDAGELAGIAPVGVAATSDVDELLALGADCHVFLLLGHTPDTATVAMTHLVRLLEAGQNVCQTSILPLYYPRYAPAELREPIATACARGRARCYSTGVYPGVMSDRLPMALLAACERVDRIRVTEILNYLEYYGVDEAGMAGIGGPMQGAGPLEELLAGMGESGFMDGAIRHLGERLGVEIDEIRSGHVAVAPAVERVTVEGLVIEPGTVGALTHSSEGWVDGRPLIEFAFVTRYDNAAAPDWPSPRGGATGCYRIEIEGSLSLECDVNLVGHRDTPAQTRGLATSSAQLGANLVTAAAIVNAIPALCAAAPGLYGSMELDRSRDLHVVRDPAHRLLV